MSEIEPHPGGSALSDRRAVVTGGSRGIGRATVERLAGLGYSVVAVGRDGDALADVAAVCQGDVGTEICDITEEDSVSSLFERLPRVDVLVNNAGVSFSAPLARTRTDAWQEQIDVNATGAFLCTRAVVPGMVERGNGRVVFVASTAGRIGYPYTSGYVASKHAAVGLMRAAATELAGTGVTANAVCPAFVETEMTARSIARIVAETNRSEGEAREALAGSSPLGRLLETSEVAAAVAFLASDEAAAINGQTLVLDGGGIQT